MSDAHIVLFVIGQDEALFQMGQIKDPKGIGRQISQEHEEVPTYEKPNYAAGVQTLCSSTLILHSRH